MTLRTIDEPHRGATQLELFFDLTFVVAVAGLTGPVAERIADGDGLALIVPFLQVFFAIWWAWMNFTWFASSYDTDDVPYRVLTLVQMGGVLVLAAGVPVALEDDRYTAITGGYLIMRTALVAQWMRAAAEEPRTRGTARRYASGILLASAGWLLRLCLAEAGLLPRRAQIPVFVVLAAIELAVPPWAERRRPTNWHPHHIAERYGLFAIVLLGEGVLAPAMALDRAISAGGFSASLVVIAVAGLVLVAALWWIYFLEPCGRGLAANRRRSYAWGYGHYGVFAALAASGAGLEVTVSHVGGHAHVSSTVAAVAVAVPVGIFLVLVWLVNAPIMGRPLIHPAVLVCAAASVALCPALAPVLGLPATIAAIAAVCAGVIAVAHASGRVPTRLSVVRR
jgi:low temperature requirement protein LtrA